jgi:lipopolysaccharide transport system ATP-binding protein
VTGDAVVSFESVSKRFNRRGAGAPTVQAALIGHRRRRQSSHDFWALRDINLRVGSGEAVGVVGANGSGKTTLLRLAGGLGKPTSGRVRRTREASAVLSLGESFDPLLSGRENAITAGILAGYTRKQARRKLEEIVAFAELERFVDDPLRPYSSGMVVRLAFAAAISVDPELLLIDEVLAVGDLAFQRKCLQRLEELRLAGVTILLVSHEETLVRAVCDRVIWLADGRVEVDGSPDDAFGAYRNAARLGAERRAATVPSDVSARREAVMMDDRRFGTLEVEIADVRVSPQLVRLESAESLRPLRIELELVPHVSVDDPIVSVSISRAREGTLEAERLVDVNTASDGVRLGRLDRPTRVQLFLDRLDVPPGRYHVDVGVFERNWSHVYDYHWQLHELECRGSAGASFGPPRRWTLE